MNPFKMIKRFLLMSIIISLASSARSQQYQKTDLGIKTVINSIGIEIQFYNPSIVRVIKWPDGRSSKKESLSVIKSPEKTSIKVKQSGNILSLKSSEISAMLDLKTGKISFSAPAGQLLGEKEGSTVFTDFNDTGSKTYTVGQSFVLDKDEAIYGLGGQQQGKMVQRDVKLNMIQGNTDDYIPFFVSAKGYGFYWDNYSPTLFIDNKEETSFRSDVGDCMDYYFMYGTSADGVIARMRDLTGQVPMFPLWTFGFWQSKERYKSQEETVGVVKKYRELGVPLDGIIQDWQYWGNNYLWNAMEFLNDEFPNPLKMINDIHGLNAHMIISVWNSFGPQTKQYKELEKIGALMNFQTWPQSGSTLWPPKKQDYPSGVRVYDPFNPVARDIYWKYLNNGIFKLGMDGWWMDSSEPDHLDFVPTDLDNKTYLGSFRKVRNAFPLMTVGGLYDHQRSVTSEKRVFILTRSAFAGQQRYGATVWSGDVTASWDALKNQISSGLNFSLSNIPYWNSDIGGFFLSRFRKKLDDAGYRELYARWIQFGAFCPMMRSHGADAPREIYQFGKKGDKVYDAIEKFINIRYSLLPYIYSASWDVTTNKSSIMRALMMDFPDDKSALNLNDEYMFGKSILVCPVTTQMYSVDTKEDFGTVKTKEVYLPKGAGWIDFWTGSKHAGGQTITKETPLDIMPLYIKAGSIIPFGPRVQFATEKKWDNLEIRVYDGANGSFTLYEDENDNYNYEKGAYTTIPITWNNSKRTLTIGDRAGSFAGMITERKFNIVLVSENKGTGTGVSVKYDAAVTYSGNKTVIKL